MTQSTVVRFRAWDKVGNEEELGSALVRIAVEPPPPEPAEEAPPLDPTSSTSVGESTEFLYTGSDPIQEGVEPGTIDEERVAVIRRTGVRRGGRSAVQRPGRRPR